MLSTSEIKRECCFSIRFRVPLTQPSIALRCYTVISNRAVIYSFFECLYFSRRRKGNQGKEIKGKKSRRVELSGVPCRVIGKRGRISSCPMTKGNTFPFAGCFYARFINEEQLIFERNTTEQTKLDKELLYWDTAVHD